MAQDRRLAVAGINIRIVDTEKRDYQRLLSLLFELRQIVKFYGSDYLMMTQFMGSPQAGVPNLGVFSRFAQIDSDADWLDLDQLKAATPSQRNEIIIPGNLRPNHRAFYFTFIDAKHFIVFETETAGETLSPRLLAKSLTEMVKHPTVVAKFGRVEVDTLSSKQVIDEIIASPSLQQLYIVVKRTNQDDVGREWIDKIDADLEEQHLRREERRLLAEPGSSIEPNEETAALARYASETGRVVAHLSHGRTRRRLSTENHPQVEEEFYSRDESPLVAFGVAVGRFVRRVIEGRDQPLGPRD